MSQGDIVKLYWNIGSQPARAVKALLDIGNIKHELISKDVIKQQTKTKQYLEMNPLGQIPFIIHGKVKVGQSNAILVYLCEVFSSSIPSSYYGKNPEERAKTNQYLSWYQYYFRPALFKIIYLKVYGYIRKKIPFKVHQLKSAERQMFQAIKTFEMLLSQSKSKFVTGQLPTIADLLLYFELTNIYYYGVSIQNYQFVWKWFKEVQKIKEVKAINQKWLPLSKGFNKLLSSIKAQDQPKSSL